MRDFLFLEPLFFARRADTEAEWAGLCSPCSGETPGESEAVPVPGASWETQGLGSVAVSSWTLPRLTLVNQGEREKGELAIEW